ncbi:hypothetical protein [Paenibacillus sophorae]|nr:hypothetical protein [Paenibacillus sophorae]
MLRPGLSLALSLTGTFVVYALLSPYAGIRATWGLGHSRDRAFTS